MGGRYICGVESVDDFLATLTIGSVSYYWTQSQIGQMGVKLWDLDSDSYRLTLTPTQVEVVKWKNVF